MEEHSVYQLRELATVWKSDSTLMFPGPAYRFMHTDGCRRLSAAWYRGRS